VRTVPQTRIIEIPPFTIDEALQCVEMWGAGVTTSAIVAEVVGRVGTEPGRIARAGQMIRDGRYANQRDLEREGELWRKQEPDLEDRIDAQARELLRAICCFPAAPNSVSIGDLVSICSMESSTMDRLADAGLIYRTIHDRVSVFRLVHDKVSADIKPVERSRLYQRFIALPRHHKSISGFDVRNFAEALRWLRAEDHGGQLVGVLERGSLSLALELGEEVWREMLGDTGGANSTPSSRQSARLQSTSVVCSGFWNSIGKRAGTKFEDVFSSVAERALSAVGEAMDIPVESAIQQACEAALYVIGSYDWPKIQTLGRVARQLNDRVECPELALVSVLSDAFELPHANGNREQSATRNKFEALLVKDNQGSPSIADIALSLFALRQYAKGDFVAAGDLVSRSSVYDGTMPVVRALLMLSRGCVSMATGDYVSAQDSFVSGLQLCADGDTFLVPQLLATASAVMFYDLNLNAEFEAACYLSWEHASLNHNSDFKGIAKALIGLSHGISRRREQAENSVREAVAFSKMGTRNAGPWHCALVRLVAGTALSWCGNSGAPLLLLDAVSDADQHEMREIKFRALWGLAIYCATARDAEGVAYYGSSAVASARLINHTLASRMERALATHSVLAGSFGV
jgi:hypothetical protein